MRFLYSSPTLTYTSDTCEDRLFMQLFRFTIVKKLSIKRCFTQFKDNNTLSLSNHTIFLIQQNDQCENMDLLDQTQMVQPYKEKNIDAPVRRCENMDLLDYKRSRGKPKKNCSEVIKYDLKTLGLVEDRFWDRALWRSRIKVADFQIA